MPPIIKVDDAERVNTKDYPYAKFPFDTFNPVQSRAFEYYNKDVNFIAACLTSSGKTVLSELFISHDIRVNQKKCIYLVPFRSLAQERINEWTSDKHHFADLKVSVVTGDYRLTVERQAELDAADLIVMSYEMFNNRVRNMDSERSEFLLKVGTLVCDEFHSIGIAGRGDHIEAALMKFTEINKACRLVMLSATVPNVEELSEWISFILNHKHTVLLKSKYRPCPLNYHFEKYWDGERTYEDNEQQKVNMAQEIIEYYSDDKFLAFVHTKKTGDLLKRALASAGIKSEFHNADLDKAQRIKIEESFKNGDDLRVIIATSTLAAGINMPARRVVILGVHRGLDEVEVFDLHQMCGRAGRPQYDPMGDSYILLPESTYDIHKSRIKTPQVIQSQMLDHNTNHHKVLAFHIVSEIHQGLIKSKEDVHHWYKRSLAYFQTKELDDSTVDGVMELLRKYGAVWEEEGQYTVTSIGKISSLFYYSPFDVSDLKWNFNKLFDERQENDDIKLVIALANLDTHRFGIVSKAEREEMADFVNNAWIKVGRNVVKEPVMKIAFAYHELLNGRPNKIFASVMRNLQFDFPRLNQVLQSIDGFTGNWQKKPFFKELQLRMNYGVKGPMVNLCQLPNIGKVRANKLWQAGIKSIKDVSNNPDIVRKITGLKADKVQEVLDEARKLLS